MAMMTGQQIDPRLAIADYSGFARAGEIEGAGMAQAGQSIAKGIDVYKDLKKQESLDKAKVKRAQSFGDSMIQMLGEDNPLSNVIADQLAMNFLGDLPLSQQAAAADGLSQEITNMFLLSQKTGPTRVENLPGGSQVIYPQGGDPTVIKPYQTITGGGGSLYPNVSYGMSTTPVDPRIAEQAQLQALDNQ